MFDRARDADAEGHIKRRATRLGRVIRSLHFANFNKIAIGREKTPGKWTVTRLGPTTCGRLPMARVNEIVYVKLRQIVGPWSCEKAYLIA
jgi:hypothetical protein